MSSSGDRARILVVEDEQIVAMDIRAQLLGLAYDVAGIASTAAEALRLCEQRQPDLILMDIQLQGPNDGISAANEVRRRWQIPVVFMTAFSGEETLVRAKNSGPYGYLTKPFQLRQLSAAISVALEQHRRTREIFQEHGWLRTLLTSMSDGVIATDVDGRVTFLNPIAEHLTGWMTAEALGRQIEEVYSLREEDGTPLEQCQLRRVLASNRVITRERFLLTPRSGLEIFVEHSAAPIHDSQGHPAGAVTIISDVTERERSEKERQRLQAELQRSNSELSRFSYSVSHDLQAPAASIRALSEVLIRGGEGELKTGQLKLVAMMGDAAAGMQRLITSMLQFAQVGHGEIQIVPVPLNEVIETVRVRLAVAIADSEAMIECGDLPVIYADRVQIEQVFQNLLSNAIQYRRPEETLRITISAEETEAGWIISVRDNGQGIAAEWLERIFEPLKRLHGRETPGSGLGLALCRTIIERHGGRIWAESGGVGEGSTIRFLLPHRAA